MTQKKPFALISTVFVIMMLSVYPLFTGTRGFSKIATQKWPMFLIVTLGFLSLCLIHLVAYGIKDKRVLPNMASGLGVPQFLAACYLLFSFLSALLSQYQAVEDKGSVWLGYSRRDGLLTIGIYVLILLCVYFFASFQKWYVYLAGAFLFFQGLLATLQVAGLNPFSLYPANTDGYYGGNGVHYSGEYIGTIGNVDLMAAIFCLLIPMAVAYFVRRKEKLSFLMLLAACVGLAGARFMWVLACILGLIVTLVVAFPVLCDSMESIRRALLAYGCVLGTMGVALLFAKNHGIVFSPSEFAYVCFLGAAVMFGLFFLLRKKELSAPKVRKWLWILLGIALLSVLLALYFVPFQSGMLFELHEMLHGNIQDSFGTSRIYIWRNVLEKMDGHWLLGTGPDTMQTALKLKFYRYNEAGEVVKTSSIDAAHNEYLNILSNQGILALLSYLGALGYSAYLWFKKQNSHGVCIAGCAILGYCVQGFFGFSQYITTPMFWLVWGFFLQFAQEKKK